MDQSVAALRTGLTLLYRKWDITNHKIKNVHWLLSHLEQQQVSNFWPQLFWEFDDSNSPQT